MAEDPDAELRIDLDDFAEVQRQIVEAPRAGKGSEAVWIGAPGSV